MDDSAKRNIAFIVLLLVLAFSAVAYFVFQNFLNKGTITIISEENFAGPISISESRMGESICESLPCSLKIFSGNRTITIKKEGYEDFIMTEKISFLKETVLNFSPTIKPYLETSGLKLEPLSNPYRIVTDENTKQQKLVNIEDPLLKAITYFPGIIENPKIFISENFLLVLSKEGKAIEINILGGDKAPIENNFASASDIKISNDGKRFAYSDFSKNKIMVFAPDFSKTVIDTGIKTTQTNFVFNDLNNLLFITPDYSTIDTGLTVGEYNIEKNEIKIIYLASEISENVEQIFLTQTSSDLFIKTKNTTYRLILKRF